MVLPNKTATHWFTGDISYTLPTPAKTRTLMRVNTRRSQRGAVLIEFAMVAPLLFALILGIFTGGTAYYRKIAVVEAVREGARYGASLPLGSGVGAVPAWESAVRERVVEASTGELAVTDVCVSLVLPTGGTECGVGDPPGAAAEPAIHLVKVSATRGAELQFLFFDVDVDLEGQLAARFERDTG